MKERYRIICASYLILMRGEEVLLLRRFNTGYEDGKYSLPAGHVDQNESLADTLIREAKEEIGIDIKKENIELAHTMHRKGSDANDERIDFFFICTKWDGEIQNKEPHKCNELRWANHYELPDTVIPYVRESIQHALNKKPYSEPGW